MKNRSDLFFIISISLILLVSCDLEIEEIGSIVQSSAVDQNTPSASPVPSVEVEKTDSSCPQNLTSDECLSLKSLKFIDDYPLYSMHYWGPIQSGGTSGSESPPDSDEQVRASNAQWGCSLFAAFADPESMVFGRNFDWQFSPAILLFTHPEDGYDSVSMVDYDYLGYSGHENLTELPIASLEDLLRAPLLPFDGMNERGLVIGMAAVPPGQPRPDPEKETIDSLRIMREVLNRAQNIDEAKAIFNEYNVDMGGGPPIHYLIADSTGQSVLVEYSEGDMVFLPNEGPWHGATNFLKSPVRDNPEGQCWRFDAISARMQAEDANVNKSEAFNLLEQVSQANTQWSIVYDMSDLDISVAMGRDFSTVHVFELGTD